MSRWAPRVGQTETALNWPPGGVVSNDSAVLDAMAGVVGMAGNPNMIGTLFGLAQIKLEGRHVNDVRWCAV